MPSLFTGEVSDLAGAINESFGSTFRLQPRKLPADRNASVVVDTSRQVVEFTARLHTPRAKALIVNAYDARTDQRPGTTSNHPLLRIQPDVIAELGLVVRQHDLFDDIETGVRWRISSLRTTTNGVAECVVEIVDATPS